LTYFSSSGHGPRPDLKSLELRIVTDHPTEFLGHFQYTAEERTFGGKCAAAGALHGELASEKTRQSLIVDLSGIPLIF
jgi:hypothetical protein